MQNNVSQSKAYGLWCGKSSRTSYLFCTKYYCISKSLNINKVGIFYVTHKKKIH